MRVRTRSRFGAPGLLAIASCLVAAGMAVAGLGASGLPAAAAPPSTITAAAEADDPTPAPAVSLSAVNVPTRTRIAITVTDFQPRSTATVTETYRYARNGIFTSKTVALGKLRLSRDGAASRLVTPVQSARAGTLTVTGVDRAGTPTTLTQRIRVG
jgi:hypothetical protein